MSDKSEAKPKTSVNEDKSIPEFENLYNMKKEPDIEHSDESNHLDYEATADFGSDYEVKIEETVVKAECFNDKMIDPLDVCSLQEIRRDHNNHNESTESCSSRPIEFINVATINEQLFELGEDATEKYDNIIEYDVHPSTNLDNEKRKEIISLTDERCIRDYTHTIGMPSVFNVGNKSFTLATHEGAKIFKKELTKSTNPEAHTPTSIGNKPTRLNTLTRHEHIHTADKPIICDVCNKGFIRIGDLVKHKRIHTKPHVCDICNQGFAQSSNLVVHKRIHTGDKPYVCYNCNKGFADPSNLAKHKRVHTGDKPYACDVCNKGFTDPSTLSKHKRIHTDELPHVCDVCNRGFIRTNDLVKHKRTHTGDKPYVCDICNKGFTDPSNLLRHKRIHTGDKPYVCDICNKGFTDLSGLSIHKRIHTGDKPHVCDVCHKGFRDLSKLSRHKRIHTGDKPYVCDVCNKRFTQSSTLLVHKRTHPNK